MRAVAHGLPLKRRLRVGPAEIAFVESGDDGAPPVVLLHGFPTHSYPWRHVERPVEPAILLRDLLART